MIPYGSSVFYWQLIQIKKINEIDFLFILFLLQFIIQENMPRVSYVISDELIAQCDKIPVLKHRVRNVICLFFCNFFFFHIKNCISQRQASMVHELIRGYSLQRLMECIKPTWATEENLSLCHSQYYLDYLKNECDAEISLGNADTDDDDSNSSDVDDEQLNYGLGYDCPKIHNLWKFVRVIAGASVTAANLVLSGRKIVINWCGGWHHAQRF